MMPLSELLRDVSDVRVEGPLSTPIRGLALDSRRVRPGDLFAALAGHNHAALSFVEQALARGAHAVLCPQARPAQVPADTPWLETDRPRRALATMSRRFFGAPDERLDLVGLTGTDGKTTTARFLATALEACGQPAATVGTLGMRFGDHVVDSGLTTPEAPVLWSFLSDAADRGARAAAIEVSSAALIADRTYGMRFAGAILTSLGRDHLDLHGDLETYYAAKRMLFESLDASAFALIPADDPQAESFARCTRARPVRFGTSKNADWRVENHRPGATSTRFALNGPEIVLTIEWSRPALWDALNLAASVAAIHALGHDATVAAQAIASMPAVPGRWQAIDAGQPFAAVVDYAHTPDALERALDLARQIAKGRVLVVFGCGGDRDAEKRAPMGRIAGAKADVVIITDDNPRSEDPEAIAAQIFRGTQQAGGSSRVERISDRGEAIAAAVDIARAGDVLVVAGKGHETYQQIGDVRREFDDREVLERALRGGDGP